MAKENSPSATGIAKDKLPKHRSPNYPGHGLADAIAETKTLFSHMVRHKVGLDVALSHLGFKSTSSSGKVHLAALRAYGLLEVIKNGHEPMVKLTSTAIDIVSPDYPDGHPTRLASIKHAALAPKLHAELWGKWKASLPPDDEIRRFLVRERGFYDKSVNDFIAQYKATLAFANLSDADMMPPADEDQTEEKQMETTHSPVKTSPAQPPTAPAMSPPKDGSPFISFPLPGGNVLEVRLRSKLSSKEFATVKKLLDLSEDSLVDPDKT